MIKLIRKIKKLYRKTFYPQEDEITFDSFTKFFLFFFRLILLDLEPLSENANLLAKINHYAIKGFKWLRVLFLNLTVVQLMAYGIFNAKNFEGIIRAISDSNAFFLTALKGIVLMLRYDEIRIIVKELKKLFESRKNCEEGFKNKKHLDGYLRIVKFYACNSTFMMLAIAGCWFPYIINGSVIYSANLSFPFDIYRQEIFPFIQIYIQWVVFIGNSFINSSDLLLYSLVSVISMEFEFLKHSAKCLKYQSRKELMEKISNLVERHNMLLELSDKLQQVFESTFLYSIVISSLIMCVVLFQFLFYANDSITYIFDIGYLTSIASQIFLLCYFGQKLIDSSAGFAEGIYESNWIQLDDNALKKQIIIILLRAQRPKKLTAMGYADISLKTFASVRYLYLEY